MNSAHGGVKRVTWSVDGGQPIRPASTAGYSPGGDSVQPIRTLEGAAAQTTQANSFVVDKVLQRAPEERSESLTVEQLCLLSSGQLQGAASTESLSLNGQSHVSHQVNLSDDGTAGEVKQPSMCGDPNNCSKDEGVQGAAPLQPSASTAGAAGPLPGELSVSFLPVDNSTLSLDLSSVHSFQQQQPRRSNHGCLSAGSTRSLAVPAIAASAAASLAAAEAPWTQNTARALRRAQQEVVETLAAQGLPPPAERGYCFDLVGTRAAGPAHTAASLLDSHDWPVVEGVAITAKGLASHNNSSSGDNGPFSSSGGGSSKIAGMPQCISIRQPSRGRASFRCDTPLRTDTSNPSTPAATGADLLLMLQQRRGHLNSAAEAGTAADAIQRPASAPSSLQGKRQYAQQHPPSRMMGTVRGKQPWDDLFSRHHSNKQRMSSDTAMYLSSTTPGYQGSQQQQLLRQFTAIQHGKQPWDDLFTRHHLKQQPQVPDHEHSSEHAESRSRSTSPARPTSSSGIRHLDADVIARAARSIALHALISGETDDSGSPLLPDPSTQEQGQQSSQHEDHQNSGTGVSQEYYRPTVRKHNHRGSSAKLAFRPVVPDKWWTVTDKAVNDPLLLTMPVWMRDALDLELMPL